MYDTLWQQIQSGAYRLEDITHKINVLWVQNQLTEQERDELLTLAVEYLDPDSERPELEERLELLAAQVADLAERVAVLEDGDSTGGVDADYPDWEPWDGMSSNYASGAIVRHNGQLWISIYDGQNVWEPGAIGTESLWQVYDQQEQGEETQ